MPDYDYDKLKENYKGTLLGNYIKEMEKSNIEIRLEKKEEQQKVENLVRESFWDVYRPGCLEQIGRFGCFFVMFICYK